MNNVKVITRGMKRLEVMQNNKEVIQEIGGCQQGGEIVYLGEMVCEENELKRYGRKGWVIGMGRSVANPDLFGYLILR